MQALVVDDSRATRAVLKQFLAELGFETREAGHGLEALERLKEMGKADLVLVDWNMPEMNGFDFVCAVRAERQYDEMPLIMVTTETEISQVAKSLKAGANEYVMKPFTKEVLLAKLDLLGISKG